MAQGIATGDGEIIFKFFFEDIEKECLMITNWETHINEIAEKTWDKILKDKIQKLSKTALKFNYRAEHTEMVLSLSMEMGSKLGVDMEVLKAAALLHDIGRGTAGKDHGKVGAQIAVEILKKTNFPKEKIDDVRYAIVAHVGYNGSKPETLEARILWDADKLTKLGAFIILQRAMLLPLKGKNSWDGVAEFNKWLETAENIKNNMKTTLGLKMAAERYQTLKMFVAALNKEVSVGK